ncbi:MAG: hypothetical protein E7573_09270 [Ruminococcaceae bacterium]|nr:hypothetical protein [Oscillospiraceae bacterium]
MKKHPFAACICVLLVSVMCFSSCMKIKITLPEGNKGNTPVPAPTENNDTVPTLSTPVEQENTTVEVSSSENSGETTTAPSQAKTPLEMSKTELLEFFNNNLNGIKENMPAFKREKLTTVSDIKLSNQLANTLVGFVKGALLSEEVETKNATKGSSCTEIMSPDGERYVSNLLYEDIKSINVTVEGTNYVVTVEMPEAENPTKSTGSYAKIFNFITVDDVVNTYAPKVGATVERNNIAVKYSGSYAKATFSPDGKVVAYDTYVKCVMSLKDASVKKGITINTDVEITLVSTTNYTNFSY